MMRIIAGKARGHRIECLKGRDIRPTQDKIREAIFSTLMLRIPAARVLDLFAGNGALGLEALNPGAGSAGNGRVVDLPETACIWGYCGRILSI